MTEKNTQPFCDIKLPDGSISHNEYVDIINKIKNDADKDLKFSTTKLKMSALDLHNLLYYKSYHGAVSGILRGHEMGFRKGFLWGSGATIISVIIILSLTN